MSDLFEPKSKEEFLKEIDHSLEQAKSDQRLDAIEAVRDMSRELKAGFQAINSMHEKNAGRMAAHL